jgi:hypothetical protein
LPLTCRFSAAPHFAHSLRDPPEYLPQPLRGGRFFMPHILICYDIYIM